MNPQLELKVRDREGRAVLIRVTHRKDIPNQDYLRYNVVGLGINYSGTDKYTAAEKVESVTDYKLAPMLSVLTDMVDALLNLSCEMVSGK